MFNQRQGSMTMGFPRVGGYSALAFLATVVAANVVLLAAHPPAMDADPASVSAFVHDHSGAIVIASALAVMAWPLLFTFALWLVWLVLVAVGLIRADLGDVALARP